MEKTSEFLGWPIDKTQPRANEMTNSGAKRAECERERKLTS